MRLPLISLSLLLAASCAARADDFPCISTTFNLLSPNDKVCVSEFDDPSVPASPVTSRRPARADGASPSG